jgi:hypothetical protein
MACTITRLKSHMELREKMQKSHSPKLNDGLTSKAKHDIFEGVLSSLAKKFYKPELLENGWHEAVANHRPISKVRPRWKHLSMLLLLFSRISILLTSVFFIKAREELQAARRSAQRISRTKLPTDLAGSSRMFMMVVQRHSLESNLAISC